MTTFDNKRNSSLSRHRPTTKTPPTASHRRTIKTPPKAYRARDEENSFKAWLWDGVIEILVGLPIAAFLCVMMWVWINFGILGTFGGRTLW